MAVNGQLYWVATAAELDALRERPFTYSGPLRDPVTREWFEPGAGSPRREDGGQVLLFASDDTAAEFDGHELRGMLTYMADAAIFRDCESGRTLPIAGGWGIEIERAYLEHRPGPGLPVLVTLRGRVFMRAPEPGAPEREHLEILAFGQFWPGEDC